MDSPKVSIIVPVFNVKPFLSECLDSIINQTMEDIEIICGDGGSNDGSLEILYEYEKKDSRIKVISKKGSGYGQSMNDCMNMAKGEYIGIVESDDVVSPDMYETLYNKAKEYNLDWIKGDVYLYYSGLPEKQQLVRESIIYDAKFYDLVMDPQTDYRPYKSGLRTWSGIYKKEFLDSNNIRHNETPGGSYQDVGFFLKSFYYAKKIMFTKGAFYKWRQDNPGSSIHYDSSKLVQKSLNEWKLGRDYLESHKELGKMAYGSYNHRKYLSYRWTIEMAKDDSKIIAINTAKKELREAYDNNEIDQKFFEEWDWNEFQDFIGIKKDKKTFIVKLKKLIKRK